MQTEIRSGKLVLLPESAVEAYGIKAWLKENTRKVHLASNMDKMIEGETLNIIEENNILIGVK